jgi:hypothetical protein
LRRAWSGLHNEGAMVEIVLAVCAVIGLVLLLRHGFKR